MDLKKQVERQERHLDKLKNLKTKFKEMSGCHITNYPISIKEIEGKICFNITDDGFVHGIDAPGDWNEGFKEIKDGLLKHIDTYIQWAEEEIIRLKKEDKECLFCKDRPCKNEYCPYTKKD